MDVSAVRTQMQQTLLAHDNGVRRLRVDCVSRVHLWMCVRVVCEDSHTQMSPLAGLYRSLQQDSFFTGMESHQPLSVAHQSRERTTVSTIRYDTHIIISIMFLFCIVFRNSLLFCPFCVVFDCISICNIKM